MNQTTTLKAVKKAGACKSGYEKLLNNLGKKRADTEPLSLEQIYNSNGYLDALWCTRLMPEMQPLVVKFAAACARRVLHIYEKKYPNNAKPRKAIEAAENGSPADAATADAANAAAAAYADGAGAYAARAAARAAAAAAAAASAYAAGGGAASAYADTAAAAAAYAAGGAADAAAAYAAGAAADAAAAYADTAAAAAAYANTAAAAAERVTQDKLFREMLFNA